MIQQPWPAAAAQLQPSEHLLKVCHQLAILHMVTEGPVAAPVRQVADLQQQVAEFEEELSESTKSLTELRRAVSSRTVLAPGHD